MDKKRDNMVTLDEFKEFFNKLSTSDFASFAEFLFQIFDTNGNSTKFIIVWSQLLSRPEFCSQCKLNFCIILFLKKSKKVTCSLYSWTMGSGFWIKKQLTTKVSQKLDYNSWVSWSNFSYLLSDNGKLSASELAFVFKTSVSAMNKSYDEVQIKEIVEALWEDWGLDSQKDDLEISKVREMLSTHEGLNEGLTKR